ncbi:Hsp20/alpha crystallin family protein [Tumidithrix elongata RA019]|uniref:Hsp20/alpha crystallin family protein n=1 Tax=Tumidithrix elongata BACA0141 TaxID=2716417 RepID=A0AAW9Q0F5_9CYAN|nr:Hsp20/alpha crystallin family protein [Tumidithrix elongata RA019]
MLMRWQPFQEADLLRRQFDRLFSDVAALTNEATGAEWLPATELHDDGENLTLRAVIPGMEAKDLDIQVTKDTITLAGERRSEKEDKTKDYFWSEVKYGKFYRVIQLPIAVQNDQVKAEYNNGILTLTLPKAPELKAFKVNLSGLDSAETAKNLEGKQ